MDKHILLGVDTEDYNEFILMNLDSIFPCNIHLCYMGKNPRKIENLIRNSKNVKTKSRIKSSSFNYSLAINHLLVTKSQDKTIQPDDVVIISDSYSVFSIPQLFNFEYPKIKFKNKFLTVDSYLDKEDKPISTNITPNKIPVSASRRLSVLSKNKKESNTYSPIVISSLQNILDIHGLEENISSEVSRIFLSDQLKNYGLRRVKTKKSLSLSLKYNNFESWNHDILTYDKALEIPKSDMFIENNFNSDWGNIEDLSYTHNEEDDITVEDIDPIPEDNKEDSKEDEVFEEVIDTNYDDIPSQTNITTSVEQDISTSNNVLILTNSDIESLVSITSIIKYLYYQGKNIDILTYDNLSPSFSLINNYMIRKIYSLNDLKLNLLNLKQYNDNIIRTVGTDITLNGIQCMESHIYNESPFIMNHSIVSKYSPQIKPYCNFEFPNRKIDSNTLVFSISIKKENVKHNTWKSLSTLISKLANNNNLRIILLELNNEIKTIVTEPYSIRKNITIINNATYVEASSIAKSSALFITSDLSDLSWIGFACKNNCLVLNQADKLKIPGNQWTTKYNITNKEGVEDIEKTIFNLI